MKYSGLHEKYGGFRRPTFSPKVNGQKLNVGDGAKVESLECRLTTRRQAGSIFLLAELTPGKELANTWLSAIQLGAVCTLALGYQETEEDVFSGFVYDVIWDDPLDTGTQQVEMICLDVRGQLMLSALSDAGATRSLSQLVKAVLKQSPCTRMASNVSIGKIPSDWDLPFQRTGPTDFEILCSAADFLCYEFYAFANTVYFGPARDSSEVAVEFDAANGLMRLRHRKTLAAQCAAVAVSGTDDNGQRLYAREARSTDQGYGIGQIKAALGQDVHRAEPAIRTMAQANYLAQARMQMRQHQAGLLIGQGTGIPELRPGRFVKASGLSDQVNGSYYIVDVIHTIDETGFETYFEAEE